MDPATLLLIVRVLQALTAAIQVAPEVVRDVRALNDELAQMIAERRGPTPEEWADLNARLDAAHAGFQKAAAAVR